MITSFTIHKLLFSKGSLRRFGWAALAGKKGADRGERRVVPAKLKEAGEGLALQKPPLPIAALYRQALKFPQERLVPYRMSLTESVDSNAR